MKDSDTVSLKFSEKVSHFESLMEKLEGNANCIKRISAVYILSGFALPLTIYLGYLAGVPKTSCPNEKGFFEPALPSEACSRRSECTFTYEMDNWTKRYNLVCERSSYKDLAISVYFWIGSFGSLLVGVLIDVAGRKYVLILGSACYILGGVMVYLADNFLLKLSIMGLMSSFSSSFNSASTILLKEITKKGADYHVISMSYSFILYSISPMIISLVSYMLDSADDLWLCLLTIFILCLSGYFCFLIESPIYLYKHKLLDRMLVSLEELAVRNQVKTTRQELLTLIKDIEMKAEKETEMVNSYQNNTLKENNTEIEKKIESLKVNLLPVEDCPDIHEDNDLQEIHASKEGNSNNRINFAFTTFLMSVESASLYLLFYGISISIDSCGFDNVQFNTILNGVSSILGYRLAVYFNRFPRVVTKKALYFAIFASMMVSLVLGYLFPVSGGVRIVRGFLTMGLINFLVCVCFSLFYITLNEVFLVEDKGRGSGISLFIGKMFGGLSPYIKTFCMYRGLDPMFGFALPTLAALAAFIFMVETNPSSTLE